MPVELAETRVPARVAGNRAVELRLLGGVQLRVGGDLVEMPASAERVTAYVALAAPARVSRSQAAGELWPDVTDGRAAANLRSALWRLRKICNSVVVGDGTTLSIGEGVWLDVLNLGDWFLGVGSNQLRAIPTLLPGYYDEWVVHERERVRQDALHAVEAASRSLLDAGDYAGAIDLSLQAVAAEPLRETPHRLAIEAYLAEGNASEAVRELNRFSLLLETELGVPPSKELRDLVRNALASV